MIDKLATQSLRLRDKQRAQPENTTDKEWLRTKDIKRLLGVGDTRLYQLIRSNAFPVSRPAGGLIYAKRSDVEKFLDGGYSATDNSTNTL